MIKVGEEVILESPANRQTIPWAMIDALGGGPFMPEGREQPEMPSDRAPLED
jgi:antitoxin VapB